MTEANRPSCNSASLTRISAVLKWCNFHQRYEESPCPNSGAAQH